MGPESDVLRDDKVQILFSCVSLTTTTDTALPLCAISGAFEVRITERRGGVVSSNVWSNSHEQVH
jgi:hypothetical protein